jgi:hypothetical protein
MKIFFRQLIELWETYLMQLDADEDDAPFFKPQVVQTEPLKKTKDAQQPMQSSMESVESQEQEASSAATAAATVTVEQEE